MNNIARQPSDARTGLLPEEQAMFDETAVLLASALPPRRVSALHLQIIHARIQEESRSRTLRRRTLLAIAGWAAAVALIMVHLGDNHERPKRLTGQPEAHQNSQSKDGQTLIALPGAAIGEDSAPSAQSPEGGGNSSQSAQSARKVAPLDPDRVAQLEQRLRLLEANESGTLQPGPGVGQLVLLELKDPTPGDPATTQGEIALRLLDLLTRQFGQASAGSSAVAIPGFNEEPPQAGPSPTPAPAPPTEALATFDPVSGNGLLFLENLLPPPPDQAYQIWITTGKGTNPVSAGLLPDYSAASTAASFMTAPGNAPTAILITQEPAGGSASPGTNIIRSWPAR